MIRLRPFKLSDSEYMIDWVEDKKAFAKWCANIFPYPLTKESIKRYYEKIEKNDDQFIFTAVDEKGSPVGQFLMRSVDYEKESAYISFVIIDRKQRGKGYGKDMMSLGVKYAFDVLKLKKLTLSVYDCNERAHECYKKIGFKDEEYEENNYKFENETWGRYGMSIENI